MTILHFHLARRQRPVDEPAARLIADDCHAIAGDAERMHGATTNLLLVIAAPFLLALGYVLGGWLMMMVAWVAG